ncbi:MAG TPA: alpha/beta hydrolase [Myxococcota bacterium]|nr:alpha/beta hydrolase [Myxococcota bacterium]
MAVTREVTVLRLDDGRELAYAEYGVPTGTPVIGFHGTPGSHRQNEPFEAAAQAEGVRLIALDRPGYGHSTYDPDRRLVDWPRDVARLAEHLGLARFGVVGVSGGGPHSAACAYGLGPQLLGAAIVSGVAPPDLPGLHEHMMTMNRVSFALARQSSLLVWPMMASMLFLMRTFPDRALDGMLRSLPEADRRILARREIADMFLDEARHAPTTAARAAAQDFALFASPWGFRLEDISIPVHVFHGDADVNVPVSHGRGQADRIPNAKLHLFPGEGHMLCFEHAREILAAAAGRAGDGSR